MTGIDNTVSRRAFIGTVGAAGAALAIAGAADAAKADETSWDEERDVVVVGLGGAGAAAAVCALDGGCSVCVIERAGRGGGATLRSGGIVYMGGGTGLQKALSVEDTPEDMAAYVRAMVGNTDEALLETYLSRSTWLYDWLVSQGVEFNGTLDDVSHSTEPPEGVSLHYTGNERCPEFAAIAKPAPRGHATTEKSFGLFEPLETKVDTQATVHYNTTATELVCDEDGSVVGVACTDADGNPLRVKAAKGVILCTGAYTLNDAMLADYCSETLGCGKRTSGEFDMGDGIRMGQKVGAATSSMNRVNFNRSIYNYGDLAAGALLDEWGHRYMAEDWHGGRVGLAIASHSPAKGFIAILDSDTLALAQQTPYGQYLEIDSLGRHPRGAVRADRHARRELPRGHRALQRLLRRRRGPGLPQERGVPASRGNCAVPRHRRVDRVVWLPHAGRPQDQHRRTGRRPRRQPHRGPLRRRTHLVRPLWRVCGLGQLHRRRPHLWLHRRRERVETLASRHPRICPKQVCCPNDEGNPPIAYGPSALWTGGPSWCVSHCTKHNAS